MWTAHKIALFPNPVTVCGVELHPPTVGHYQILEHIENSYTCGGLESPEQLIVAVLVCSMRPRRRFLFWRVSGFDRAMLMIRVPELIKLRAWVVGLRMRRLGLDWKAESKRFRRFIDECSWVPERFKDITEKSSGMPNGVPSSYRIMNPLLKLGFSIDAIRGMSLPEANLHILAESANKGSEYESLEDYQAMGFPEGYAYHEEDYPHIKKMMEAIKDYEAARKKDPTMEPVNTKASIEKAAAMDLQLMEGSTCAN
jgi:hypothetical protein